MSLQALILVALLSSAPASPPRPPPPCQVKAVSGALSWIGREVTLSVTSCPPGGRAYVRWRSARATQPDSPPGFFVLRPGQSLTRRVPTDWWPEQRLTSLRWVRLPIVPGAS